MKTKRLVLTGVLALSGCGVAPEVSYSNLGNTKARTDRAIQFQLATSVVAIGTAVQGQQPVPGPGGVQANSLAGIDLKPQQVTYNGQAFDKGLVSFVSPAPLDGTVFTMTPYSPLYKTTKVSATFLPNTRLLQKLEIDTEDHRKEIIETVGTIAVGAAKFAAAGGVAAAAAQGKPTPKLSLPLVLELSALQDATKARVRLAEPNQDWFVKFEFLDTPDQVKEYKRSVLDEERKWQAAVTSLCRPGKVELLYDTELTATFGVTVADPTYLMTIPLPVKGTVEFHTLCGANVTVGDVKSTSSTELFKAVFDQIEALRNANKKK